MSEEEKTENVVQITKQTTETLKLDKRKANKQKDLADKVKDIIYAVLLFLSRFV